MKVIKQLQTELNEAIKRKKLLNDELSSLSLCIEVFQKEIDLRKN